MLRDIQWLTRDDRGVQGVTRAYSGTRGCVQGRTDNDRVYMGSVHWHTGDVQAMTVKTQGVTVEDGIFIRTVVSRASSVKPIHPSWPCPRIKPHTPGDMKIKIAVEYFLVNIIASQFFYTYV